jgi:histidinol-phosphate aminotransferase
MGNPLKFGFRNLNSAMAESSRKGLVRPLVRDLHAYVPGEQPQTRGLIKLNTNENPHPPSPKVLRAVQQAVDGRLRLYPSPDARPLRELLAQHHGCGVENIIVGNGSDELLALATRAFVEPASALNAAIPAAKSKGRGSTSIASTTASGSSKPQADARSLIQYFWPSYSLYPVLTDIHGAVRHPVALPPDFALPSVAQLRRDRSWRFDAALTFLTTPNAPSGRGYSTEALRALCQAMRGVIILDEAYVDFADENASELAFEFPNVVISRTFSKAYSLCFQRIGYFIGPQPLIDALHRIRDSYNVNGLGQVAAEATLRDLTYYRKGFQTICRTRQRVKDSLTQQGWQVYPSQTNFLLATPPGRPASEWHVALRSQKIVVRWFAAPEISHALRITIGSDQEMDRFLTVTQRLQRRLNPK